MAGIYWISIGLSLLPGFVWLFFYLREDPTPEPPHLLVRTFTFGAIFAFFTLAIQIALRGALAQYGVAEFALPAVLLFAFSEEFFKFIAAYASVHGDPAFDEPSDYMIYMVVAALGFATVENLGAIGAAPMQSTLLNDVFQTTTLRFVGATLLHTLGAAFIGYYWALGHLRPNGHRFIALGFVLATVLHASFNYLIILFGNVMYAVVFVVSAGFFILHDFEVLGSDKVNVE